MTLLTDLEEFVRDHRPHGTLECSPIFCSGGELRLAARTRRLHPDFRGVPDSGPLLDRAS